LRSILFLTMEPMMFKGASEFSPASRGPQTSAWSRPLPPPSTITGALATLILQYENRPSPRGDPMAWYEEISGIFGKGSTVLRGPYLIDSKGVIYVQYGNGVLQLDELVKSLLKGELFEASRELNKAAKKFELGYIDSVGIRLSDMRKAAGKDERGLLYSTRMVDYGKIGERNNVGCSIMVEVLKASDSLKKALETPKVIRLGGEGRLVKATTNEIQPISEFVRTENDGSNNLRLYLATSILFEASPRLVSNNVFEVGGAKVEGATTFVSFSVEERLRTYLNDIGFTVTSIEITGRLGIVGGFSVAKAARKPMYAALHPGSIIEITRDLPFSKGGCYKLYSEGLGLFRDLGYGTIIPVPITEHA